MNKCKFYDKHGIEIMPDMTIRHINGDTEKVYAVTTLGVESLGILATNPDYLKHHPDCDEEYYDLSEFDLTEWEIVTD